ncbi:MAG: ArnT family glycosyltransferase [Acidobacteriota bacterium]
MQARRALLLLVFAAPLFVGLEDSSIWDSNEAYYAQTPREMITRSDWLVPYFNGQPRLNKPPLSYWVVGLFYKIFSVSVFWERLAMALLGLGSILTVHWMGGMLFDGRVALWGAGIFATTFRFLVLSRRLFIDVLMLFCILMAVACFVCWLQSNRKSTFLFSVFFLALGFLSKGPVVLLTAVSVLLFLFFSGNFSRLREAPLWRAGSVFILVSVPWFLLVGERFGWERVAHFFLSENWGRFSYLDYGPSRGVFYYFGVFLGDIFPWSLFFPAALAWWASGGRRRSTPSQRQSNLLLLFWVAAWFIVFSLSRNKQEYYILPVYPAVSLLLAYYFRHGRPPGWVSGLIGALLVVLGLALFGVARILFPQVGWVWLPGLLLAGFPFLAVRRSWTAAVLSLSFCFDAAFFLYLQPLEAYRPVHHFARELQSREMSGNHFVAGYYRFPAPSLAFYLDRPILELNDFDQAVKHLSSSQHVYLIVGADDFEKLQRTTSVKLEVVETRPRLSTRGRSLLANLISWPPSGSSSWTRTVYLITNGRGG